MISSFVEFKSVPFHVHAGLCVLCVHGRAPYQVRCLAVQAVIVTRPDHCPVESDPKHLSQLGTVWHTSHSDSVVAITCILLLQRRASSVPNRRFQFMVTEPKDHMYIWQPGPVRFPPGVAMAGPGRGRAASRNAPRQKGGNWFKSKRNKRCVHVSSC